MACPALQVRLLRDSRLTDYDTNGPGPRIHKHNLPCLLLTFLPYYSSPTFCTLLSILPETVDPTFRFIQPYIKSLTNPSRHSIVQTATTNQSFFRLLTFYVFDVCRKEYQYPTLLSFWSSITSEAVASMLDRSRTGRKELQRKNQNDIKLLVLPLLSDGLLLRQVADVKVGCYMILAILSSKTQFEEDVLISLMDTVTSAWDFAIPAGLICLAVLAQQRRAVHLPQKTLYALLAVDELSDDLVLLSQKYKVEKLVLGLILGIVQRLAELQDIKYLTLIRILMEADLMQPSYVALAIKSVFWAVKGARSIQRPLEDFNLHSALADLLLCLADSSAIGYMVLDLLEKSDLETRQMKNKAGGIIDAEKESLKISAEDEMMLDIDHLQTSESFDALLHQIPTRTAFEMSFLSHTKSFVFKSLSEAFLAASLSSGNVDRFTNLAVLRKPLAMTEPLYFSFFIRMWCGSYPEKARSAAIVAVQSHLKEKENVSDLQALLPYLIYALGDPSSSVRRAATHVVLTLMPFYQNINGVDQDQSLKVVLGQDQIYGQGVESEKICWLPTHLVAKFIEEWLVPSLEECCLDPSHILSCVRDRLNGLLDASASKHAQSETNIDMRSSILKSLCSHVSSTPLHTVRFRLLPVVSQVNKTGTTSGSKLLMPLLEGGLARGEQVIRAACEKEHIDALQYSDFMMAIVTPKNRESIKMMQTFISSKQSWTSPMLCTAFYRRLAEMWPSLKPQQQDALAAQMLELAISDLDESVDHTKQDKALQTLRSLKLPARILYKFCQDFPTFSILGPERGSKRRRIQKDAIDISPSIDDQILKNDVKRSALVLELIESSNAEHNPELLGPLFKILTDLHSYQNQRRVEFDYLKLLIVGSLLRIIKHAPVGKRVCIQ